MTRSYKLLGTLEIEEDGHPSPLLKNVKGCALVGYLIVTGQPQSREALADLIWNANTISRSMGNLRSMLNRIRDLVPELSVTRNAIGFHPGPDTYIDLARLTEALLSDNLGVLDNGLRLYRADLLSGLYLDDAPRFEEWLLLAQERLRLQVLAAHERLCRGYSQQRKLAQAEDVARRWLALDPLDEEALRQLLTLLALNGRPGESARQYEVSRLAIWRSLRLEPEPVTTMLARRIRSGDLALSEASPVTGQAPGRSYSWDETPLVGSFFGRTTELAQLSTWVVDESQQMVSIVGIGGVGKTTLTAQAVRTIGHHFDKVVWRSLLNAPMLDELLPAILLVLSDNELVEPPAGLDARLSLLLTHLRKDRCLLVLDNLETIMSDKQTGVFQPGYQDYGRLLLTLSEQEHQGCLLITSREHPLDVGRLSGRGSRVRTLPLSGLEFSAGGEMLRAHGLQLEDVTASTLVNRYSGNPLALALIAEAIQEFYAGDATTFVGEDTLVFARIRDILDQQFEKLSPLEQEILIWLAIAREATPLKELLAMIVRPVRQREMLEALLTLQRRSLLEKGVAGFVLQNVITEYLTDVVVERTVRELRGGHLHTLVHHALLLAQAKSYLRRSQERLILKPIVEQLLTDPGKMALDAIFRKLLDQLRNKTHLAPNYAAGNILNFLLYMGMDITGYDFSHLPVWQAYLQEATLYEVNFVSSDLSRSIFFDTFGIVTAVAFSPDGLMLAAGTGDGQIRIWNVASGQPIMMLQGDNDAVWSVNFSPDGRLLASGGADSMLRLWDIPAALNTSLSKIERLDTGQTCRILAGHEARIQSVTFSPDGRSLATGSEDRTVRLWDLATAKAWQILGGHGGNVQTVAYSPDGRFLATGSRDQTIRLWDISALTNKSEVGGGNKVSDQASWVLTGHTNWINEVAFTPDGKTLASVGEDGTIRLWDLSSLLDTVGTEGKPLAAVGANHVYREHSAGVQTVAITQNGRLLASGSNDQTIRLRDLTSGQVKNILLGHTNWVYSVRFSPDGQLLASGSWDHSLRLWRTYDGQEVRISKGYSNWVFSVDFSPDCQTLACGCADNRVRLWDNPFFPSGSFKLGVTSLIGDELPDTGSVRKDLAGHTDWAWKVVYSPDGRLLASAGMDRTARVWDPHSGQTLHVLHGHEDGIQAIAFSPDGSMLATGGLDQVILLWELSTGQIWAKYLGHTGWCLSVDFSPDGQTMASSGADHTVRLWYLAQTGVLEGEKTGKILYEHDDGVQQIRFSPDGKLLASASWDKSVKIWDIDRAETRLTLWGHTDIVRSVVFSPDGMSLLSGSDDRTLRLWDVSTGQLFHILEGHAGWVFSAVFSRDGFFVASASSDETIKIWDAATGKCLQTWPMPRPYEGMDITNATGLTNAQKAVLKKLGSVERV